MDEPPGRLLDFLRELKRRNVYRVAAAYAVVAFAVLQLADLAAGAFGFPPWFEPMFWVLLGLGLPIALVLAWAFEMTAEGVRRTPETEGEPRSGREASAAEGAKDPEAPPSPAVAGREGRLALKALVGLGLVAAAAAGGWYLVGGGGESPEVSEGTVAVLPFRVAGADAEVAYLREGMLDLLGAKLTGEVGPRAVDSRTVVAAWRRVAGSAEAALPRDSALMVGRMTGAAHAVLGSVVGTPGRLVISASLLGTAGGEDRASAEVVGPADSLPALVDDLASILLSLEAGQDARKLSALTGTSLPALRLYLVGEAAYRRGEYARALDAFEEALALDSTFAMAAFGIHRSAGWVGGRAQAGERGLRIAWAHRDRLSAIDRLHLRARAGPSYPASPTARELLEGRERAVDVMPDRPEVWYELGDVHLHWGWLLGERDALDRAMKGFRRALELDPGFAGPVQHGVMIAAAVDDTTFLQDFGEPLLRRDSTSPTAAYVRWRMARVRSDTAELERLRDAFDRMSRETLRWIGVDVQDNALPVEDGVRAVATRAHRGGTRAERREQLLGQHAYALHRGRPQEALRVLKEVESIAPDPRFTLRRRVLDALYAGGDPEAAAAAADTLSTDQSSAAGGAKTRPRDACVLGQWRLHAGEGISPELPALLREAAGDGRGMPGSLLASCAELLAAQDAAPGTPERRRALARLDSVLTAVPYLGHADLHQPYYANLALARMRRAAGELEGALAAAGRRMYYHGWQPYTASFLLTEAQLAARLGLTDRAIGAYRGYLNLRDDPEARVRPEVEAARAGLDALLAGRGGD